MSGASLGAWKEIWKDAGVRGTPGPLVVPLRAVRGKPLEPLHAPPIDQGCLAPHCPSCCAALPRWALLRAARVLRRETLPAMAQAQPAAAVRPERQGDAAVRPRAEFVIGEEIDGGLGVANGDLDFQRRR